MEEFMGFFTSNFVTKFISKLICTVIKDKYFFHEFTECFFEYLFRNQGLIMM